MGRGFRSSLCVLLVVSLLANAFCAPPARPKRDRYRPYRETFEDDTNDDTKPQGSSSTASPDDDDDDDFSSPVQGSSSSGGGSNIMSLLNLAGALFPGSSSSASNRVLRSIIRQYLLKYQQQVNIRRQDIADNVIDIDYITGLTPPFQRQEDENDDQDDANDDDDEDNSSDSESEEDNAAEESVENNKEKENGNASKQDSNGDDDDNDSDYSDEPEGDGQGGGILGLLAGLSGGEDGSDLGTLLATVGQIVGNLSGDEGFDLNSILATAFGLFVGLLSEGKGNPGTVIASYLLTSLDTITGGGSKNNGAFFGNFLMKLIKGISADEEGSDEDSDEDGEGKMKMTDSTGFFVSLLMSLSGDMSKGSSGGSSHPW